MKSANSTVSDHLDGQLLRHRFSGANFHHQRGRYLPQRRYGTPEEIGSAAAFLASDDAAYITGHTLNVNGGFLAAGLMFPFDPAENKPIGQSS